ncbi:baseplate megatron protein TIM-barrel domain-containing protein [Pontivivens ytuae]|nr:phage tail protein [Pontivivens ytuae]
MGGRGAGKTRAGSEWIRTLVEGATPEAEGAYRRIALVGETYDQARDVMVLGESGIIACSPPDRKPKWISSRRTLVWPNGAEAQVFSASDPQALRGPQFDAAWCDEFGCPAIDKGTNQPNVFLDEKSSENALPHFSTGARDDFIQYRYLDAVLSYWADDGRNPISEIYDGPMLRLDRCHVWAWDTRPWPESPNRLSLWSDGVNYGRGHWISGRLEMATLADVTEEVCARSGVTEVDVSGLHGGVGGMEMRDGQSARSGLQPLMLAFGFDAVERDGELVFITRTGHETADLRSADLALVDEEGAGPVLSRGAEGEQPDRVRLRYIQMDHDYQRGAAEALDSFAPPMRAETSEVPLALHTGQAQGIAERLLDEGRIARDGAKLSLPPSQIGLEPGDVVRLDAGLFRLDRIEEAGARGLEATRVDPAVYVPAYHPGHLFDGPGPHEIGPVLFELMDLPLLNGDEVEHAPYLAATSEPWPGAAAVYISSSSSGFELAAQVTRPAVMGTLVTPLAAAPAARWSAGCEIELVTGELEARSGADVLDGANAAALRNGAGDWEVIQFRDATLVGPDRWRIGGLLRGQAGTEFVIPPNWEVGTRFVLLDDAAEQIDLPLSARGLERQLRVGPASRPVDDESYAAVTEVFEGVGLRPYAPVHLRARRTGGDLEVRWIRRTRVDGDLWTAGDVPLSEEREAYLLELVKDGAVVLSREVVAPLTVLAAADLPSAPFDITVSQISARFGPGAQQRMTWND